MSIEEYKQIDPSFELSMFMTKVNNIFIKLFTSIMMDKLDDVKHFISQDTLQYASNILNNAKNSGNRQMFDELNVKDSNIIDIQVNDNVHTIKVYLQSRYMDYIINLSNGNLVSGNNTSRIQVDYDLTFVKKSTTSTQGIIRKCPSCGAALSVNTSGKCEYCGSIYNQSDYDWVLDKIEKRN